jgi:glucokinase
MRLLVGDIGRITTLRLVETRNESINSRSDVRSVHEGRLITKQFDSMSAMVNAFLGQVPSGMLEEQPPRIACFAIPGPVVDGCATLTNREWEICQKELAQDIQIPKTFLINDFEAICRGIGLLDHSPESADIYRLTANRIEQAAGSAGAENPAERPDHRGAPGGSKRFAVIGAGTGLGEAVVLEHGDAQYVFSSEGGHADFAPSSEVDLDFWKYLRKRLRMQLPQELGAGEDVHVSQERVVCGQCIIDIFEFLRDAQGFHSDGPLEQVVQAWRREYREWSEEVRKEQEESHVTLAELRRRKPLETESDAPAEIAKAAMSGTSQIAQETMDFFLRCYGSAAGNLALKTLPRDGVVVGFPEVVCGRAIEDASSECYVAGSIAPKIITLLDNGVFMKAFVNKGRMRPVLERIPVYVVLCRDVGIYGACSYGMEAAIGG